MDDVRTPKDTFAAIDAGAWRLLQDGATDAQSGFHYVTLCTVSRTGVAQARTVVLRHVTTAERMLEIHTDVRSPKWSELAEQPQATVLGFCNTTRVQLRLQGSVHLFSPDSDVSRMAWKNLSPHTRATYTGGPPGDDLAFPRPVAPNPDQDGAGANNFGVIRFRASMLDWFRLQREENRRAIFAYGPGGKIVTQAWVNP